MQLGLFTIIETKHDCTVIGCTFCAGLDEMAADAKEQRLMFHHLLPSANGHRHGACVYSQDLTLLRDVVTALFCQKPS